MPWIQMSIQIDPDHADEISASLEAAGAVSVTLEDGGDEPVLEPGPGETPLWRRVVATALFELDTPDICESLSAARGYASRSGYHLSALGERPWEREWLKDFQPMRFGERLWICPGDQPPPEGGGVVVRLDPGLAFGTGTHPTTALCLEWLEGRPLDGRDVVDFGCGSGILAIAAARLGARTVFCVDNDEQALIATRENGVANGVGDRLSIAGPDQALPPADVLVSNILSGPLVELARQFAASVRSGGAIVLSGILGRQADEVAAAYAPWFDLEAPAERDQWIRLSGQRREND